MFALVSLQYCFYDDDMMDIKWLGMFLVMYSNVKSTGLPLGLFSTSGNIVVYQYYSIEF